MIGTIASAALFGAALVAAIGAIALTIRNAS